jgi:uncharacterized membrane protein YphA (DoxX/SURF4 family)
MDSRRYLSTFAVFSLVLLRLVIGWHFFGEGSKKLEYDRHDGTLRLAPSFSAEGFLTQAKGPLAKLFHSQAPDDHGFRELLAVPRQNVVPTADQAAEQARWRADYDRRRAEAAKAGGEVPIEFPPSAPYHAWAARIADDWRAIRDDVKAVSGLTDAQKKQADEAFTTGLQQVADYLAGEAEAITEYQHELWRLQTWRSRPEAGDVPFYDERIANKAAQTGGKPPAWLNQVGELEAGFLDDLRGILTTEQRGMELTTAAFEDALSDSRHDRLRIVDVSVTVLTVGVGICLLLGFCTRLAAIVGALFLLTVVASQPAWLPDAAPTISQWIELPALLVLAGTGAGRWAGLDYFIYALFHRGHDAES